ncbi:MAG: SDR family NAD(P)-dependent oxidoreductase [Acidimicrobiales bacterium]
MGHLEDRAGLDGAVALVVGGGGGLGRAAAEDLGRAGVRLAVCDRDAGALGETAAVLTAGGAEVLTGELDARDGDALGGFFDRALAHYGGRLDVLVNVVGGTFRQPFEESSSGGWEALIRANFTWLLGAVQRAIPPMRAGGGGSIVTITSIEAHRAAPRYAVYAAMKAAVTSLTRSLAVELAPDRIRVNTIAPDYVPTPGLRAMMGEPDGTRRLTDRIATPMGRAGTYDDVGGCVLFLASELSAFVTGSSVHPDGGALASSGWFNWPGEGFLHTPPAAVVERLLDGGA